MYFNFKYLPFNQAIKIPILISRHVYLKKVKGKLIINSFSLKPGMIKLGFGDVGIFDKKRSRTIWEVAGQITFNGKAEIGHGSKISIGETGTLNLGDNFKISAESTIICFKNITIGDNTLLSWEIQILDTDFHKIFDNEGHIINKPSKIIIGNKVWICSRSTLLKGTIIPDNSIIAANSLVNKHFFEKSTLIGGNPSKIIKKDIRWEG